MFIEISCAAGSPLQHGIDSDTKMAFIIDPIGDCHILGSKLNRVMKCDTKSTKSTKLDYVNYCKKAKSIVNANVPDVYIGASGHYGRRLPRARMTPSQMVRPPVQIISSTTSSSSSSFSSLSISFGDIAFP